jgi:lipopolysaccharide heptosyltransferase II
MRQYSNILVHSLVNLGDVLLATSAVALIKKINPSARITMMVRPAVRELVENNPVIDDVLLFDYKAKQRSLRAMLAMVREIKRREFDLCISLDRKLRPAILTWLAGIPVRVCPERIFDARPSRVTWFYTDVVPMPHDIANTLQAENCQAVVRGFFHAELHAEPVMGRPSAANETKAAELLRLLPPATKRIALCVKGTFPLKTWPKEYFLDLLGKVAAKYQAAFFIIGSPADYDYAEEVVQASPVPIANFCGKTMLKDMVPLFRHTDLFVTVDTGAAHIAATTKVPMVTIYGCESPRRWYPINPNARVLTADMACCPCHLPVDACPSAPEPECLWRIEPDGVLAVCIELLEKAGQEET